MKVENIFPVFETERLLLRELSFDDTQKIFELFSNPAVIKYHDFESYADLKQAKEYIQRFSNGYLNNEMIRWGIVLKETDALIGTCGLHTWNQQASRAEIGFDLDPQFWGRGIMQEAINVVLKYGYSQLHLNRIEALSMIENTNCVNFLSKLGFTEEGTRRELRCFSLLKKEFIQK